MNCFATIKLFLDSRERLLQFLLTMLFLLIEFTFQLKPQIEALIGAITVCSIISMGFMFYKTLCVVPEKKIVKQDFQQYYQPEEMKLSSLYPSEPINHFSEQPPTMEPEESYQYQQQNLSKIPRERKPAYEGLVNQVRSTIIEQKQQQQTLQRDPSNLYDIKSIPSVSFSRMTTLTNHGQLYKGGEKKQDYFSTQIQRDEDKKLNEKFIETGKEIKQTFKINLLDFSKRSRVWFIETFIPLFINEYKQTLYGLEKIMKQNNYYSKFTSEYFDKRLKEIQILYAENILDYNLHQWNESVLSKKETTIDQMLEFYTSYRINNTSVWTINDPIKFKRDDENRFFKLCQEMELYNKILFIVNDRRQFPQFKDQALIRLNQILKTKLINFNYDAVPPKSPSDTEILSSLFINTINSSIEYENTAGFRAHMKQFISNDKHQELRRDKKKCSEMLKYLRIGVVTKEMMTEKKLNSSDEEDQTKFQSYLVQQINGANPLKEPHYHFCSMQLQMPKQDLSQVSVFKPKLFISPPVNKIYYQSMVQQDEKGLFVTMTLYMLHLVLVPTQSFNQMMSYGYNQKFLSSIIEFAKDITFQVNI